jgi:hypothetical protein
MGRQISSACYRELGRDLRTLPVTRLEQQAVNLTGQRAERPGTA